jgi:hypothetical protein
MDIKTNFIITCEKAFLTAGSNNLNLVEIFSQVNASKFPFVYPRFALVVNFDTDTLGANRIITEITAPDGSMAAKAEAGINITSNNFQIITNFENLAFSIPGDYEIKVSLDTCVIAAKTIVVKPIMTSPSKTNIA